MQEFSKVKEGKEQIISVICSETGLDKSIVEKIYNHQKDNKISDSDIKKYFDTISIPNEKYNANEFASSMIQIIKDRTDTSKNNEVIVSMIKEYDDKNSFDSFSLLQLVDFILDMKNPKKNKSFIEPLKIDVPLNESFDFDVDVTNTVQLYESLRDILSKNNKRWGYSYHLSNSHQAMIDYLNNEIETIQLRDSIETSDNQLAIDILNNFLSNKINPIYKSHSAVKGMLPDTQGLVFDMILLVDAYLQRNSEALKYISTLTYNEYQDNIDGILSGILSSVSSSNVLNDSFKKQFVSGKTDICSLNGWEGKKERLHDYLTNNVSDSKLNFRAWDINLVACVTMIDFIKSSSFDFNLKLRPVLRNYVTKAYSLLSRVEKANKELYTLKNGIRS